MCIHLVGIRADLLCVEPLRGNSNEQEQAVGRVCLLLESEPNLRSKFGARQVCGKVGRLCAWGEGEGRGPQKRRPEQGFKIQTGDVPRTRAGGTVRQEAR